MLALAPWGLLLCLGSTEPAPGQDPSASPEAHLVDMVVAQVDSSVITFSELSAETRLVLLRTGGPELARAGALSPNLLAAVLRTMVMRELILGEVRRLKLRDVSDAEVKRAVAAIRDRFVSSADYERFLEKSGFGEPGALVTGDVDAPPGLVALLKAELSVERFIEVRTRRNIVVRESDVMLCYEANKTLFGTRGYGEVKSELKMRLEDQARDRALDALVEQLERRANIRYTPSFEPPPKPPRDDDGFGIVCPEPRARGRAP